MLFAPVSQYMRLWDFAAAQRIDSFVANSQYVAQRIRKYYRRESTVIHPPVDTRDARIADTSGDYYLSAGRLVPAKKTELAILACNRLGRKLRIIGTGPEEAKLHGIAGPTIEFLGRVDDAELRRNYAGCRALLFAADEDFGIVPVEAQAAGRPVIAFGSGGSLETVLGLSESCESNPDPATGLFFQEQTADSLQMAMLRFEAMENGFNPFAIQRHARGFDTRLFTTRMRAHVESELANHAQRLSHPFPLLDHETAIR